MGEAEVVEGQVIPAAECMSAYLSIQPSLNINIKCQEEHERSPERFKLENSNE